ncbi:MAG TPA: hypothetical protein VH639_25040 [Bryobacteraceae bacterium]|jgi:hypothetical protein
MHGTCIRVSALTALPLLLGTVALAQNASTSVEAQQANQTPSVASYAKRTVGIRAVVGAAAGAGVTQGTDTPTEWGEGAAGFGRRFASSYGKHIVGNIIRYPVARLTHEELYYRPSGKHGFGPRLKYALLSVVITHKTTTGKRTTNLNEISGAVGSGLISRLWQPTSTRTIALGFSSAGTSLAVDAGIRVLREFWPEIRHPHRHTDTAGLPLSVAPGWEIQEELVATPVELAEEISPDAE